MSGVTGMVHQGVLYSTPAQLADQLCTPVGTALAGGEPVVAVLDEASRSALVEALGPRAAAVEFRDPARVHSVPAFTVAVRWARLTRRVAVPGGRATVVGQHVDGLPGCGPDYWARLDAALNVALHGLPITMLCPYPEGGDLLLRVRSTHRTLLTNGHSVPSDTYRDPGDVVAEYPPPPPPDLGPPSAQLEFRLASLPAVRHLAASASRKAGFDPERVADFVLAVNEIVTNSVEHGAGAGRLRLWVTASGITGEVHDAGRMAVPFPGMVAPPPSGERGRGLWLASELCDVLQVWSDPAGTVVRLLMEHRR
jgi:anti-sigma regulatory factor (Ser/Thr protein kinase)